MVPGTIYSPCVRALGRRAVSSVGVERSHRELEYQAHRGGDEHCGYPKDEEHRDDSAD